MRPMNAFVCLAALWMVMLAIIVVADTVTTK
jgi:hypothetical protein